MIKQFATSFALTGYLMLAGAPVAAQMTTGGSTHSAEPSSLTEAPAMVMLDYQVIPVPGSKSIDLMGFHLFTRLNDWLHVGVGGHAPLLKGEYGGFMVFDAAAHVQRKVYGDLFANAGVSLGGGGGGKSVALSRVLSGTGGFVKGYVGLGYDFKDFSVGANLSKIKFTDSAINHSQLSAFVQVPFSYTIGSYADSGARLFGAGRQGAGTSTGGSGESIWTVGLDNIFQIDPEGLNKGTINNVDLQYSHFITNSAYWFFNAGGGYRGRPLYNQVLGGLGYRTRLSPSINVYGQLGVGSGGYAPETINTGPGLLIYPRLSVEYLINKNLGVSLSAGYLFAPKGSSKNYTLGALLNYHIHTGEGSSGSNVADGGGILKGYRFNLFHQTEKSVVFRGADQADLKLISMQIDTVVSNHVYIPLQVSVAHNEYLTFPGYGEVLLGVGIQNRYAKNDRFQFFGQLLLGANPHGTIFKTGVGLQYGLNDHWAIHGVAGQTFAGLGSNKEKFRSDYFGIGLTYRFSVPSR